MREESGRNEAIPVSPTMAACPPQAIIGTSRWPQYPHRVQVEFTAPSTTERNSKSVERCWTPRGKTNYGSQNRTEERRTGARHSQQPHPLQAVNLVRSLTVPGFGGTANLKIQCSGFLRVYVEENVKWDSFGSMHFRRSHIDRIPHQILAHNLGI